MAAGESPVLLIGIVSGTPTDVFRYVDGQRTSEVTGKRASILSDPAAGEVGITEVTIPVKDLHTVNLAYGSSVVWWVRFGAYGGGEGRAARVTCAFIAAGSVDTAGLVGEKVEHMAGRASGGRRAES